MTVSKTLTRAKRPWVASTTVHGASAVLVRSSISSTASSHSSYCCCCSPLLLADLPGGGRVFLDLLEPLLLLLLVDVQPELDDHRAGVGQLPLELLDVLVGLSPLALRGQTLHPLDQHAAVPGAVEDGEIASAGRAFQNRHIHGCRRSSSVGGADRMDLEPARVERLGQAVDERALAGRVPALETRSPPARPPPGRPRWHSPRRSSSAEKIFR